MAYFVTSVTYKRKAVFAEEKAVNLFLLTIEYLKLSLDYRIFAFCILSEHIHFIIQPFGKYNLSYIMLMIKGNFSRRFNKMYDSTGHIWQKRFYDEGIRNEGMLISKIEYIHNNPLKHGIVADIDKFVYSSYQHYFNGKTCLLKIDPIDIS
ncbi:MAG: transposase [Candidatus Omnitrophota bacterium]|nr:MAG: transposase [Candidatus Omnitrophota bacterium]